MQLSEYVEKWDSVLFSAYNITANMKWLYVKKSVKQLVSRNAALNNKHCGERCFLVLNGPSIKKYDLSKITNEQVLCTNFFYRSAVADVVVPNYICWQDASVFNSGEGDMIIGEILERFPNITMIFNLKAYSVNSYYNNIYYTYNKHLPHQWGISSKLEEVSSAFSTVAFYAINAAIYMGFKKIYVLGLDFAPGAFEHFDDLGVECTDPTNQEKKVDVCGNYWAYAKAHYEAYALNQYAKTKGIHIVNLNKKSCIRAFDFGVYEDLF